MDKIIVGWLYDATTKSKKEIHPADHKKFTLNELQSYVCGYIELIDLYDKTETDTVHNVMIVNEDGITSDMPINDLATERVAAARPELLMQSGIRGDTVELDKNMLD